MSVMLRPNALVKFSNVLARMLLAVAMVPITSSSSHSQPCTVPELLPRTYAGKLLTEAAKTEILMATSSRAVRVIGTNDPAVTMDYHGGRVNIIVDRTRRIIAIACD
jgi:hypothetical protein